MAGYDTYPGVDSTFQFPAQVRQALANADEMETKYAHHDEVTGVLVIGSTPVEPTPVAAQDVVGWVRAVFIAKGATIPAGVPVNTLVIEEA